MGRCPELPNHAGLQAQTSPEERGRCAAYLEAQGYTPQEIAQLGPESLALLMGEWAALASQMKNNE